MQIIQLKNVRVGSDTVSDMLTASAAILGIFVGVGILALLLWFATGKW